MKSTTQEGLSFPGGIQAKTCDLQTSVLSCNLWWSSRAGRHWAPWRPRQLPLSPSLPPPLQSWGATELQDGFLLLITAGPVQCHTPHTPILSSHLPSVGMSPQSPHWLHIWASWVPFGTPGACPPILAGCPPNFTSDSWNPSWVRGLGAWFLLKSSTCLET